MNPNPYYYGLVKQIGPWKTTAADIMRGQKEYQYTPNNQAEVPYDVKAGNGMLYETYASQGLIYDASTSPVITIGGKARRGKITKAKKVQIIDPDGKIVAPTDNYFLDRYMGEMRQEVGRDIIESELGGGLNDMATMSGRPSTVSMRSASTSAISTDPSENAMDQGEADGPMFENLNLGVEQEEMVDRGAQNGAQILNDQIGFIQALEEERIYARPNVARDRWNNPEMNIILDNEDDRAYLNQGEQLPMYNEDGVMDLDPVEIPGYQQRRRRSSLASSNPAPNQRQRR